MVERLKSSGLGERRGARELWKRRRDTSGGIKINESIFHMLQSPGTLHKDVGGAGTKVSGKTVGGVGTATLTTLSSINNTSNATRNKNNPVSHEVRNETREFCKSQRRLCSNRSRYIILGQESCRPRTLNSDKRLSIINRFSMLIYHRRNAYSPSRCIGTRSDYPAPFFSFFVLFFIFSFSFLSSTYV